MTSVNTGGTGTRKEYATPGTGVNGGCEPLCGCWQLNSGPLEEPEAFLTVKLFLAPLPLIS